MVIVQLAGFRVLDWILLVVYFFQLWGVDSCKTKTCNEMSNRAVLPEKILVFKKNVLRQGCQINT